LTPKRHGGESQRGDEGEEKCEKRTHGGMNKTKKKQMSWWWSGWRRQTNSNASTKISQKERVVRVWVGIVAKEEEKEKRGSDLRHAP